LSLYVILLIVSCYWYATRFVVENIALKKPTWIGGRKLIMKYNHQKSLFICLFDLKPGGKRYETIW